ncbi:hypothetical protein EW026_g5394 [Hermanssonia centrifuga]|uniref:LysM domain-containing protein n=1 Tax=Hermanssonia centrifuga TaxID=98765 RepID=A0A4S4KIK4_9APHY|nr:hypothetical protein EW026_g5394 [Hermanssonia centrifuga]
MQRFGLRILYLISLTRAIAQLVPPPLNAPGQFQLWANASEVSPAPSEDCADALASVVACNATLLTLSPRDLSTQDFALSLASADLDNICTTACENSLTTITTNVDGACSGEWTYGVNDGKGTIVPYVPSLPFRQISYTYSQACAKDSSGEYCYTSQTVSDEDLSLTDLPPTTLCDECHLALLRVQMTSSFGYDASFESEWIQIQGICGVNYTVPTPDALTTTLPTATPQSGTWALPAPTRSLSPANSSICVFGDYTVASGDTCDSIASAQSVAYTQLISVNGLQYQCNNLPPAGTKICLPGKCTLHVVTSGDTCMSISGDSGITWTQFISWNPQVNSRCSNLNQYVGEGICISPPGGGYNPGTTISGANPAGTITALALPTGQVAPGSNRQFCGEWYTVQSGETCPEILQRFGITNDTFYYLNPVVNSDCSNLYSGFDYCVAEHYYVSANVYSDLRSIHTLMTSPLEEAFLAPSVTITPPPATVTQAVPTPAPGTLDPSTCLEYYTAQVGDTCFAITVVNNINNAQFLYWNSGIKSDCSNLVPGLDYCLASWNPELDSNCILQLGLAYCVAGPTATTPPSTPTQTIASGTIITGCKVYHTVVSGDYCYALEQTYAITFAQLQTWNPELDSNCILQLGLSYCVSGP